MDGWKAFVTLLSLLTNLFEQIKLSIKPTFPVAVPAGALPCVGQLQLPADSQQ